MFSEEPNLHEKNKLKTIIDQSDEILNIIHYLNEKANKQFNERSKTNIRLINTILKEGYTVDDAT